MKKLFMILLLFMASPPISMAHTGDTDHGGCHKPIKEDKHPCH
jgi:hypothetical protein